MPAHLMSIPPDKVESTRLWFETRGGCVLWRNQEIGVNRPEQMTPAHHEDGTAAGPPHWAYGNPQPLQPADIVVRTETTIVPPFDWFPGCENCQGSGRRPLQEVADARGVTLERVKEILRDDNREWAINDSDNTLKCFSCDGTGHIDRRIRVALRKRYWGYELSDTGKKRADKAAKKLGQEVKWDWNHDGYGLAVLTFYTEKFEPFTLTAERSGA